MTFRDPYHRNQARKDDTRSNNMIRNKMQLIARGLEHDFYSIISKGKHANPVQVSELIGKMKGYIQTRRELAPDVAQDGFSDELSNCIRRLSALLASDASGSNDVA